jgi:hypothetical protein
MSRHRRPTDRIHKDTLTMQTILERIDRKLG